MCTRRDSCPFLLTHIKLVVVFFFVVYSGKDVLKKIKEDTGGEFRTTLMNLIEVRPYWLLPQNSKLLFDWTSRCQATVCKNDGVTAFRVLSSACGILWLGNEDRKLYECFNEHFPKTTLVHCVLKWSHFFFFPQKKRDSSEKVKESLAKEDAKKLYEVNNVTEMQCYNVLVA